MQDCWDELGASMRRLREASGESLRHVETVSCWRRGTLSQVETGKVRPNSALVEFYDQRFFGNGLLSSLYADAHAVETAVGPAPTVPGTRVVAGDDLVVASCNIAAGALVAPGSELLVQWTLHNRGSIPWQSRRLRRVGATAGARLLSSTPQAIVPDTAPGETTVVTCAVQAPLLTGTLTAHWRMAHADGAYCFAPDVVLHLTVVVA